MSQQDDRAEIRCALQDALINDDVAAAVLTGYIIVAEWSDASGVKWLTRTAGNINDEVPTTWDVKGWLHHSLDSVNEHGA